MEVLPLSSPEPEPQFPAVSRARPHECGVIVFWLENAGVGGYLRVFSFFPWRLRIWKQGVCGTLSSSSPSQGPWKQGLQVTRGDLAPMSSPKPSIPSGPK